MKKKTGPIRKADSKSKLAAPSLLIVGPLAVLTGCGEKGGYSLNNARDPGPVSFSVEPPAACQPSCGSGDDIAVVDVPAGTGTAVDPYTAMLCDLDNSTANVLPLRVDVANAAELSCTPTGGNITTQIAGTSSLEFHAQSNGAAENFSCTASNSRGSATFFFSLEGNTCCFSSSTQVLMEDGSFKAIDQVRAGDRVRGQSGAINTVKTIEAFVVQNGELYAFNGSEAFVTSAHPLMTLQGWKALDPVAARKESPAIEIGQLSTGDVLVLDGGGKMFLEVITKSAPIPDLNIFNLLTDGNETYHVSVQGKSILAYS